MCLVFPINYTFLFELICNLERFIQLFPFEGIYSFLRPYQPEEGPP